MRDFDQEIKDVETIIRRMRIDHNGQDLSRDDQGSVRSLLLHYTFLLRDLLPHSRNAFRQFGAFLGMSGVDVLRLSKTLSFAASALRTSANESARSLSVGDFHAFKQHVKMNRLYWGFLAPIEGLLRTWYEESDIFSLKSALQWCDYGRRLNLKSLDVRALLEHEYISFEDEISAWSYDEEVLDALNAIMRTWLKNFNFEEFQGKHGPGAVAEIQGRPSMLEKYQHMVTDPMLNYFYKKYIKIEFSDYVPLMPSYSSPKFRLCKLVFVPKSIETYRTISKEPTALQFTQQGISRCIRKFIEKSDYLSQHIKLHDQSWSCELARQGSIMGRFDTIDLSMASDCVSLYLVKRVFAGTPLLAGLLASRSRFIETPEGKVIPLNKFAPMGSAVCFPIETLVFAAITELAIHRSHSRHPSTYSVYGDDIIIPCEATEELINLLHAMNFRVNLTKSFFGSSIQNFRESCGGEYVNGFDITPHRISRKFEDRITKETAASWLEARVDAINEAYNHGLLELRRFLIHDLLDRYKDLTPLFTKREGSGILTFPHVDNGFHCRRRFSSLHRLEGSCDTVVTRETKYPATDADLNSKIEVCAMYEWFRRCYDRIEGEIECPSEISRAASQFSIIKRKWMPL